MTDGSKRLLLRCAALASATRWLASVSDHLVTGSSRHAAFTLCSTGQGGPWLASKGGTSRTPGFFGCRQKQNGATCPKVPCWNNCGFGIGSAAEAAVVERLGRRLLA